MVIARRFITETQASIYAAQLRSVGIECFVSNTNTATLLPFNEGGFVLHVQESDKTRVDVIFSQLDENANSRVNQDFRNADLDDIEFEKSVTEYEDNLTQEKGKYGVIIFIIVALILAAIVSFIMRPQDVRTPSGMRTNSAINLAI